jgi:hypothetical protein
MRFAKNSGGPTVADEIKLISFDEDLDVLLDVKPRTRRLMQKLGTWPIPKILPRLDRRRRYAKRDVEAYLNREPAGRLAVVRKRAV